MLICYLCIKIPEIYTFFYYKSMKIKHFLVAIVLAGFPSFVSAQFISYQYHELSAVEREEDL